MLTSSESAIPRRGHGSTDPLREVWVAVNELKLNYHNPEAVLFGTSPHYGNLNSVP